ncbi:MAG: PAS domain S-box protein, partial [Deltaproteobacteria bacterium]|nr:PAS domain S-box protein [Deltaproteobacteria bacterium]
DYIAGVSIFRDISERKKAETEIREGKEFLENLFKTSSDAILVTDPKGETTMVNDAMEKMVGYSRDELLGKHTSMLSPPDKELRSRIVRDLEKLFKEGRIHGYETVWQRKDGQQISVESNRSLLKDKDGQIIGGVSFTRDVTEKKKVESMLLQAEKLKSLGELAGGVAHDFNNVLAAILGRVQLLKRKIEPPSGKRESRKSVHDLKKGLEIIEKASLDGAETVRRIQEFSRRRADDKNFTQVDINELIDHALEFTRVRWKDDTESKGMKVEIIKELSSLPPIAGSASELREVFTNFINNAMDAMPEGGQIKIKTFKKGNHIFIKLGDTGIGIPKDIRERIFDPFFTTKGPQSTGLGMSVSYGIINRHRGIIGVGSTEGKGTTFTIKLPITSEKTREEKRKPLTGKRDKARILVVEDEEGVRELLKDILIDGGHEVETASRGSEGVKMLKKKDFDLVFTDLGMPGMSGW